VVEVTAAMLDQRITILIPEAAVNIYNEPVETLTSYAVVWAMRHDASTREAMRAREIGAEIDTRFTVRWSERIAAVDARFAIQHRGRTYNITGVRRLDDDNHWLEIDAVARADDA